MTWTKAGLLVSLSAVLMLAACQSTTTLSAGTDRIGRAAFCDVADPILYSRHDTPETQKQVREHNAVGVALGCPAFDVTAGKWAR